MLRADFGPESDVNLLVEFEPGHVPGLIQLAGMENELGEILGRKVDLLTPMSVSPYCRDRLVHGYDTVDLDLLWRTVIEDLPAPIPHLERAVAESG